jgi:hypothetical protein
MLLLVLNLLYFINLKFIILLHPIIIKFFDSLDLHGKNLKFIDFLIIIRNLNYVLFDLMLILSQVMELHQDDF